MCWNKRSCHFEGENQFLKPNLPQGWVGRAQVCSNKGRTFCQAKMHLGFVKVFSRTTRSISTKLTTNHPWVIIKNIQICTHKKTIKNNEFLKKEKTFHILLNWMFLNILRSVQFSLAHICSTCMCYLFSV